MSSSRFSARPERVSVSYRNIGELKPDPRNARMHSKAQVRQLAASIEAFGFNVPILVDEQDNVLAGHGRLLACKQLGYTQVPTIRLEHLSAAQARAFQLADNRLAEIAVWDERLLAEQLKELSELNLDFSIETTGFSMGDIDFRIESLTARPEQPAPDPDDIPPARAEVAVVADALLDCSKRNDVVLDAFLGSGTTLIAAERVGRICYALEIDPLYIDVSIRRWQAHSGGCARLAASGESFAQREANARAANKKIST